MRDADEFRFEPGALRRWIAIGRRARRGDARFVAPLDASLRKQFDAAHPQWRHAEHRLFAVGDDARCAAIVNPRLEARPGAPTGQIGWFEAAGDEAGRAVLEAACAWLRAQGCRLALGPMHGSTWHSYRFVTDWCDFDPFALEPNNPTRYPALFQVAGFRPCGPVYYSSVQSNAAVAEALRPAREKAEAAGYRVTPVDLAELPAALRRLYELSRVMFRDNAFYADISWEEFAALYDGIERALHPGLLHWLLAPDGEAVGFGFGLPDHVAAIRRLRGRSSLLAKLRYATAPRPRRSIFKSMGILPDHQGRGLASLLYHEQSAQALRAGFTETIRALMPGRNRSFQTAEGLHRVIREYRLFEREL